MKGEGYFSRMSVFVSRAVALIAGLVMLAGAGPAAQLSAQESSSPQHGAIHGVVVDQTEGMPLTGSVVRIVELNRQEVTHGDGTFHLERVPAGSYTLLFERPGYRRSTMPVRVAAGETVQVRVELAFSAISLPGLVVTGQLGARLGEDAIRTPMVMSGQELERRLDVTLGTTLQNEPGLASVSLGPATARPVIRGLGGDRILMLEDGERIGDLSASSPDHAVAIEPLTARQIEVVRGPSALLYGSNALGGVVNVIREEIPVSPPDQVHGSVTLQGQSINSGLSGGGFLTGGVGSIALRAEASARTAGDLGTPIGSLENTGVDTYNLSTGASWVSGWGHAGGAYRYYKSDYGIPPDPIHGHAEGVRVEMERHTARGEARVRTDVGPFSSISLNGSYSRYTHREVEEGGITGTEFGVLSGAFDVLARHEGGGILSDGAVGAQFIWRDFAAGGSLSTPPSNDYTVAAYAVQEVDLEPLRLEFGARYDHHRAVPRRTETRIDIGDVRTRTFGSLSASAAAVVDIGSGLGVGASLSRSFRTPDTNELFSQGPHLASYSYEVGNPDLEAEVGIGTEVFVRLARETITGEAAVFRNSISGYIYPRNTGRISPTQLPIYQFVGEDAVLTGVEGRAEWVTPIGVVLDATGSYVRGTLTRTDEPLPLIPPLNGRVDVRYEKPSYFVGLGWRGAAKQDRLGEFEEPTDGYHLFDAVAGYRWARMGRIHSLTLRLENLTDTEYRDHLSRIKHIMPQAGRGVSLLYRLSF